MTRKKVIHSVCWVLVLLFTSCLKQVDFYRNRSNGENEGNKLGEPFYIYPFQGEEQQVTATIELQFDSTVDLHAIQTEIPYLKYNKSWLLMLTQDDGKQVSYCRTWAAINGRPVSTSEPYPLYPASRELFYEAAQYRAGDLPPNLLPPSGTLGYTDGAGNEIRFAITATLLPEEKWMQQPAAVKPGFTENYYRFYMRSGLVWNDVIEMVNFGTGIAFHDVLAEDQNDPVRIAAHFAIAQDSIRTYLSGRGCKMLAEPNGNKAYVTAALQYPPIRTMTAQTGAGKLYPLRVSGDLKDQLLQREFNDSPGYFKDRITAQLQLPEEERECIHIGLHDTHNGWIDLLSWVNDTYGKDGDDSVWFPSQEEYYEYTYYRIHGTIQKRIEGQTLYLDLNLPGEEYFYYPSVTINLPGIKKQHITAVSADASVTGLSVGDFANGVMVNVDCRKFLLEHATHYVEEYEKKKTDTIKKADALYFVNLLKDTSRKETLLNRIK